MINAEIASSIERGIFSQTELITSLALAIIAGLLAFVLRLRLHNESNRDNAIRLHWSPLLFASLLFAGLAIAAGFIVTGRLVEMAPVLYSHNFDPESSFSGQNILSHVCPSLNTLSRIQIGLFLGAIIFGSIVVLRNVTSQSTAKPAHSENRKISSATMGEDS